MSRSLVGVREAMSRRSARPNSDSKVGLFERDRVGGLCLNWGCIPSKAILRNADVVNLVRDADAWGIKVSKAVVRPGQRDRSQSQGGGATGERRRDATARWRRRGHQRLGLSKRCTHARLRRQVIRGEQHHPGDRRLDADASERSARWQGHPHQPRGARSANRAASGRGDRRRAGGRGIRAHLGELWFAGHGR